MKSHALQEVLVLLSEPSSTASERFRSLRTNISRLVPKEGPIIGVCSTWPQEGKSSISANLAVAFGQVRPGSILVDADLRRPTLTALAGLSDRPGLAGFLRSSESDLTAYLDETGVTGLRMLAAGQAGQSPVDFLAGSPLDRLFNALGPLSLPVVVDTPPLSVGSDALLVGSHCDGILLVVHARQWEGRAELEAKVALEDHGARILGVVLNEVKDRSTSYPVYRYQSNP